MKSAVVVGGLVVVVTVAVAGVSAVTQVVSQDQAADQARAMSLDCNATPRPDHGGPGRQRRGTTRRSSTTTSARTSRMIIQIGKERQLPPLAWQVAIQAGMTESGLRNLNYGDRDSLGMFQMRPSMGWGTPGAGQGPELRDQQVLRRPASRSRTGSSNAPASRHRTSSGRPSRTATTSGSRWPPT